MIARSFATCTSSYFTRYGGMHAPSNAAHSVTGPALEIPTDPNGASWTIHREDTPRQTSGENSRNLVSSMRVSLMHVGVHFCVSAPKL